MKTKDRRPAEAADGSEDRTPNRDVSKRTTWLVMSAAGVVAVAAIGTVADLQAGRTPTWMDVVVYLVIGMLLGPLLAGFTILRSAVGWMRDGPHGQGEPSRRDDG